jgi:hypothetical protein
MGPVTLLFWMGLILALANELYRTGAASDFNRLFAASLVAFFVAQARDFSPVWFIPFMPALVALGVIARRCKAIRPRGPAGGRPGAARGNSAPVPAGRAPV